jgi:hypothetical protein
MLNPTDGSSVLNPDAEVDDDDLDASASPTPAFSGASSQALDLSTYISTITTTRDIPAVLTASPVSSDTFTSNLVSNPTMPASPNAATADATNAAVRAYGGQDVGAAMVILGAALIM